MKRIKSPDEIVADWNFRREQRDIARQRYLPYKDPDPNDEDLPDVGKPKNHGR